MIKRLFFLYCFLSFFSQSFSNKYQPLASMNSQQPSYVEYGSLFKREPRKLSTIEEGDSEDNFDPFATDSDQEYYDWIIEVGSELPIREKKNCCSALIAYLCGG